MKKIKWYTVDIALCFLHLKFLEQVFWPCTDDVVKDQNKYHTQTAVCRVFSEGVRM